MDFKSLTICKTFHLSDDEEMNEFLNENGENGFIFDKAVAVGSSSIIIFMTAKVADV